MFNPAIVGAIIIQIIISKFSRLTGAIVGYLITTGILIWGISVYAEGDQIAFLGIALSQPVFIVACLVWYGFDTWELMSVRKIRAVAKEREAAVNLALQDPLVKDKNLVRFYQTTMDAWASGKLNSLNKSYQKEGKTQIDDFIKNYPPYEGSTLRMFFEKYKPLEGEFLVGMGEPEDSLGIGWFVMTNRRLIQKDGRDNQFKEVTLADVDKYKIKGANLKTMNFNMKSGEETTFEKVEMYPLEKYLDKLISGQIQ
jgi:hypothetical protein